MKLLSIFALGSAVLLAACGQNTDKPDNTTEASATMGDMSGDMGNMAMPAETAETAKVAKGTGTVKAIDETAGTITLEHGPIAEANWPAMTMAFKAAPALIDSVAVGDKVAFDLALKDGIGEVTAIQKQ
jgi:Cu/Ag efflux protein CusF